MHALPISEKLSCTPTAAFYFSLNNKSIKDSYVPHSVVALTRKSQKKRPLRGFPSQGSSAALDGRSESQIHWKFYTQLDET